MQISNSAYMGVEVLVRLAAYEPNRCCTAHALAEWINRSMTHTETLMSRLRAAGLVPRPAPLPPAAQNVMLTLRRNQRR